MTKESNLCTHPWIPVALLNGSSAMVSLEELYEQAENIRDLVLSPMERISVMRLLICITQRALNGPSDAEEKEECQPDIIPKSLAYLRQWRHAFELYGENGAFLQVPNLTPLKEGDELTPCSKLALSQASGNNSTLFDNAGGSERSFSFSQLAINLLTFQNFSPGGLISEINWANCPTPKSSTSAPCVAGSALHLFIIGKHILETIWMNLCPKDEILAPTFFGVPVWEDMPISTAYSNAVENATKSYLGRMVPLSRCVQIKSNGLLLGGGLEIAVYDEQQNVLYWEPSTRRRTSKEGKTKLVNASMQRALWRQLPAMLQSFRGQNHWLYQNENLPPTFSIWVGALVVDKASILGEMGSCFPNRNISVFGEHAANCLAQSLLIAQKSEACMSTAICSYHALMGDTFEKKQRESALAQASEIYWNYLSSNQPLYLRTAQGDQKTDDAWTSLCRKACKQAYDSTCPHSTARQMQAWVRGWNQHSKKSS